MTMTNGLSRPDAAAYPEADGPRQRQLPLASRDHLPAPLSRGDAGGEPITARAGPRGRRRPRCARRAPRDERRARSPRRPGRDTRALAACRAARRDLPVTLLPAADDLHDPGRLVPRRGLARLPGAPADRVAGRGDLPVPGSVRRVPGCLMSPRPRAGSRRVEHGPLDLDPGPF